MILLIASLVLSAFNLARLLHLNVNTPSSDMIDHYKNKSEIAADEIIKVRAYKDGRQKELEELLEKQRLHLLGVKEVPDGYMLDYDISSIRRRIEYQNDIIKSYLDDMYRYTIELADRRQHAINLSKTKIKVIVYLIATIILINLNFLS